MAHGEHAQSPQLLRGVEHHRRKTAGHFGIQADLDPSLDFILTLHQQIQQLLSIYNSFPEISHQANQSCVPFIDNLERKGKDQLLAHSPTICRKLSQISLPPYLSEGCGARGHEDLPHSVVKPLHRLIIHTQEALSRALLGDLESTEPSVPSWEPLSCCRASSHPSLCGCFHRRERVSLTLQDL